MTFIASRYNHLICECLLAIYPPKFRLQVETKQILSKVRISNVKIYESLGGQVAKKSTFLNSWLHSTAVRVTRVHFIYIGAFILSIVIFDSWNLYTHDAVSQLWTAAGVLLVVNTVLWYVARMKFKNNSIYVAIVWLVILTDIIFASYIVYWQHGLASKAVVLFTVPIVTAAVLRSRSMLLAATTLCAAAYSTMSVRYFFHNYGLSYRVELWGTVGLYSALFFVLAGLLLIIVLPKEEKF